MENLITKKELDIIIENSKIENKIIILKFEAPWCKPCQILNLVIEKISNENNNISVIKINIDDNAEITTLYKIRSIPSVYIYKGGIEVNKFNGTKTEKEILILL
jgi:thioredoxin 1